MNGSRPLTPRQEVAIARAELDEVAEEIRAAELDPTSPRYRPGLKGGLDPHNMDDQDDCDPRALARLAKRPW